MTKKGVILFLVLPTVVILAAIVIFPMIYSIVVSFMNYDLRIPKHSFAGFNNFTGILKDSMFYSSAIVTGIMLFVELVVELLLGLFIAMILVEIPFSRKIYQPILLIPMMVMPVVVGYVGRLIFAVRSGPINYFLNMIGVNSLLWHASPHLALVTIMILRIWRWTPFVMATLLAGILSLPIEPYESVKVDGANKWQTFIYITLPMLKPIITLVVIMRALEIMQAFDIIYVLTMGGPGISSMPLSLFTYLKGFRYWNIGQAAAAAWLIMIPLSILVTFFVKLMEKGEEIEEQK